MKQKKWMAALFCAALLLFSGCGATEPQKDAAELQKITVGEVAHSIFYAPGYVAMSLGYFADEGLEIDLINLQGDDKVMSALISDEIQVGLMGPEASVYVANQNLEDYAVNFAQLTQRDGSFFVGREPVEDFNFAQLTKAEIIGGRKGGVPEMTLEYVLKTNDESKPVNVRTDIQFAAMAGSFASGEGDYVTLFEPTATQFEREGKGYILASIGAQSGNIPYTAYSASKSYMEANPEIIQKFTNALQKGMDYVQSHTPEEIAEVIAPQFKETDLDTITTIVKRYYDQDTWKENTVFEKDSFELLQDILEDAGELNTRAEYEKLVETEYAQKACES